MHRIFFNRTFVDFPEEESYNAFCKLFKEVHAAGGLVFDGVDSFLMIYRNGHWDLPKGHLEEGESLAECAVREVSEETGLERITLGKLLCVTEHCYYRDGIWHLKHNWWYDMSAGRSEKLVPQAEEGIEKAEWIHRDSLPECLGNCYISIKNVFDAKLFSSFSV